MRLATAPDSLAPNSDWRKLYPNGDDNNDDDINDDDDDTNYNDMLDITRQ